MKKDTRLRRAWREAGWPAWSVRVATVIATGALALYVGYTRHLKSDALQSIALGVAYSLGGLLVVHLVVYMQSVRRVSRRMAEEAVVLRELRRVISDDVRLHGPQLLAFGGTLEHFGVPFTQRHIAALRTLQANGEVGKVEFRRAFDPVTGEHILDAFVYTVRVLDG